MQNGTIDNKSAETRTVEVSPAIVALITWLVEHDQQKRTFTYWADNCLVEGYKYCKRLHDEAVKRERYKQAEKDRAAFHEYISRNPKVLGDKSELLRLAKVYNQMDDILVKALSEPAPAAPAPSEQTAPKPNGKSATQ